MAILPVLYASVDTLMSVPEGDPRKMHAIRLSEWEKRTIEGRAQSHGLTLSEYMRRCSLGELADRSTLESRVEALEIEMRERLDKLERMAELGAY